MLNNNANSCGTVSVNTMYATKRRRRSVKTVKPPMKDPPKSNPSKRHRERLNSELDHLASLLPFEQSVISKLDKLSVLRLAVSYLRTKAYFLTAVQERYHLEGHRHHLSHHSHLYSEPGFTDVDSVLQALNGFLFVVSCDGEVFFSSRTVEQYLGFHQSDIIHQSALELIHSEDREEFKSQLNWRSQLPSDHQDLTLQQVLLPENSHYLQRCFTVRFRCLLDNTSGFITLEICGRIKVLHSQPPEKGTEEPPLALFAICCPFGPLPLLDVPPRDYTFKTKHKMDMAPVSMDPRGKLLFGFSDRELVEKGGYDLIHPDDLTYYAAAHQELIKTGSSGLIAYRLMTKDFRWIWLQTSSKVIYKNSKPDFVICTHRHLTEDEGKDLVGKRGSEFKLPYPIIDADPSGLGAALEEEEYTKSKSPKSKKSKNQLRDYLQAGRKRKTPYRDVYNGINGYSPYSGINGYPACQPGNEMKPEFMYPYTGQNFTFDADLYRSSYPTLAGSMYPSTADAYRLDSADKHGYTNGYYLEPRQYQHTLQYHGNGYSDLMAQTAKYSYDAVSKYGYDAAVGGYSLDLTKRSHYDDDITRYENDLRKYSDHYAAATTGSRVNGSSFDAFRSTTGSFYGSTATPNTGLVANDGLLTSCNPAPHGSSPPATSLYRPEISNSATNPAEQYHTQPKATAGDCKQQVSALHTSVIRNASPRGSVPAAKSPPVTPTDLAGYTDNNNKLLTGGCPSSTWAPCHKSDPAPRSPLPAPSRIVSPAPPATGGPKPVHANPDLVSAATQQPPGGHSTSPAVAATATSVIQQPTRHRSCDKQASPPGSVPAPSLPSAGGGGGGGIAVPVVKSSAWLHHLPSAASAYNWHLPSSADGYAGHHHHHHHHQGALHSAGGASDGYSAAAHHQVSAHAARTIVEAPKVVCYGESW